MKLTSFCISFLIAGPAAAKLPIATSLRKQLGEEKERQLPESPFLDSLEGFFGEGVDPCLSTVVTESTICEDTGSTDADGNGGCFFPPYTFTPIPACDETGRLFSTVTLQGGLWANGGGLDLPFDTDWYSFNIVEPTVVTVAGSSISSSIIDGYGVVVELGESFNNCSSALSYDFVFEAPDFQGAPANASVLYTTPGDLYILVLPTVGDGYNCPTGANYSVDVTFTPATALASTAGLAVQGQTTIADDLGLFNFAP